MIGKYFKSRAKTIFLYFLLYVAAGTVAVLYQLPVSAVCYAGLLCGALLLAAGAHDLLCYIRKTRQLEFVKKEILVAPEHLPQPESLPEEQYQELIHFLWEEKIRMEQEKENRFQEMMEYYTMWAHQIKTPIAAARLILQSAEEDCGEKEQAVYSELKEEVGRIDQYADMVMCYLRLDTGTTDYVIKEYELDGIVRQAVRTYASVFIRKKLRLIYEPLEWKVLTDEKWLLFVISQVLSNALKYTPSGSVTIYKKEPQTLCIKDTGIGIAPEDLLRIFEKGYTGSNGRADKKASGIGLYLCRRICTNLGHKIIVRSAPGEGTEVCICLERAELEVE